MPRHSSGDSQVVRCLTLLVAMARAKRGVKMGSFAKQHGWNPRTLYRDIDTLRAAGVPVEHEHGWYRVADRWLPAGTVDMRRDELMALSVIRQIAPGLKDTIIGRGLDGLWSKLSTPGHQLSLALGDETWLQVRTPAAIDYGPHRVVLDTVREAVQKRRALRIHYCKSGGEHSDRIIEPHLVRWEPTEEALYVYTWCRLRSEPRTFAIHRIVRAELTDEPFAPRREAVVEMSKAFRLWARNGTQRMVLRFSPRVAGELRERRWHPTAHLTDTDDGGVVLEMDIGAPEEAERWLLGYGADVEVEKPATLAERIHDRHAEAAAPARLGTLRAPRPAQPAGCVARRRTRSKP